MAVRWVDLPLSVRDRLRGPALEKGGLRAAGGARRRGGLRARASGEGLETRVMQAAITQRHLVELEALPACGARFVGKGRAKALPICCDFAGCVVGPGTGIYFDAKRSGKASLDLGNPAVVKTHQREFLERQAVAGAIAGILAEHGGVYRWLDGRHLAVLPGCPRAIKWEDPRWHVLGESIDFGRLLAAYGVNR